MKKSPLTLINESVWFPGSAQAPWWMATSDKCPVNGWVLCVKISSTEAAGYNTGQNTWLTWLLSLICHPQNRDGKSHSPVETEFSDMNRHDIWKQIFENYHLKKKKKGQWRSDTHCSPCTNTHALISISSVLRAGPLTLPAPHSQTRQNLESGCRACILSSCAYSSSSPDACVLPLFTQVICPLQWKPSSSSGPRFPLQFPPSQARFKYSNSRIQTRQRQILT